MLLLVHALGPYPDPQVLFQLTKLPFIPLVLTGVIVVLTPVVVDTTQFDPPEYNLVGYMVLAVTPYNVVIC
jgi:hypothetical protein